MSFVDTDRVFMVLLWLLSIAIASHTLPELKLQIGKVYENSALLHWFGLETRGISDCEISYNMNGSMEWNLYPIKPLDNSVNIDGLIPSTLYFVSLTCHANNKSYTSHYLNFTTVEKGANPETEDFTEDINAAGLVPTTKYLSTPAAHQATVTVTLLNEKFQANSATLDIVLGVIFGFVGMIVVVITGYYLCKKYRRRQRIRRFLAYRHQENESFPDDADEEDHSVVL